MRRVKKGCGLMFFGFGAVFMPDQFVIWRANSFGSDSDFVDEI